MKIKFFLMFFAGFILYLLLTASVLLFYKDDPAQMTWQDRENFNAKLISGYNLADHPTQDEITGRLGGPDITEAVELNGKVYQLFYYRTHRKLPDGITTEDECTALFFKERQLIAKGEEAIIQYQQQTAHAGS
tara:strand:- start:4749 stop:5147 length:399 start_codon:yes stop_codon:yes gene_type:complete